MVTWKQIFGPNFSVVQIEALLMVGAFGAIFSAIFILLYLYNQLADDLQNVKFFIRLRKRLQFVVGTNFSGCGGDPISRAVQQLLV